MNFVSGLVGIFIDSILNPTEPNQNQNEPNSNNSATESQQKQKKEDKSLWQQKKDIFN